MFQLISLAIALGIGFAAGYGVREAKSRRRRVRGRKEDLRRQEQKRYDSDSKPSRGTKFQSLSADEKKEIESSATVIPAVDVAS